MPVYLTATAISSTDFQSVLTTLQGQISVEAVVGVLGTCATASIGLVFMWWGVRKVTRALMAAFRKGRISL